LIKWNTTSETHMVLALLKEVFSIQQKALQSYWNTPIKNVQNFMTGKDIKKMLERVNKELKRRGRVIGSFSS